MNTAYAKIKAQARLAVNKLQIIQQKESALAKQNRRQLGQLLDGGKLSSAKIRVENVIAQDINVELLELLELYCELVVSRSNFVDKLDRDARLKEAVYTLIYAAPYADIKELTVLKDYLVHMLPKEEAISAIENKQELVPAQILKRLEPNVPSQELVELYLKEIAKAYNINVPGIYEVEPQSEPVTEPTRQPDQPSDTASTEPNSTTNAPAAGKPAGKPPSADDDLWSRFNSLKK